MKKKLYHYSYDSTKNPYCGGGGAYRDLYIHKNLSKNYKITFYVGHYKGAVNYSDNNVNIKILGFGNQLLSRFTFSLFATIHAILSNADLNVIAFSVFSPVLSFLFRPDSTIIVIHHILGNIVLKKYGFWGLLPLLSEKLLLHFNNNFITSAESIAEEIRSISKHKHAKAVYNGFDLSLLRPKGTDKKYILSFGRIDVFMKGQDLLIKAFEQISVLFPEYSLIIAGKGKQNDIILVEKMISGSPVNNKINFIKSVTDTEKQSLLSNATFVCIPSRFEGWCIVAIEAAASSQPILGTKINGLVDTIQDGVNGILVQPENVDSLAEGMKQLLGDQLLRNKMSSAGFEWAKRFSWEDTANRQNEFYVDFTNRKRGII